MEEIKDGCQIESCPLHIMMPSGHGDVIVSLPWNRVDIGKLLCG